MITQGYQSKAQPAGDVEPETETDDELEADAAEASADLDAQDLALLKRFTAMLPELVGLADVCAQVDDRTRAKARLAVQQITERVQRIARRDLPADPPGLVPVK